jgi:hypothetical protein
MAIIVAYRMGVIMSRAICIVNTKANALMKISAALA